MMSFAKSAFINNESGARLEGEFIADTGPTWMIKPANKPVQVLLKSEWTSAAFTSPQGGFGDIFGNFTGR